MSSRRRSPSRSGRPTRSRWKPASPATPPPTPGWSPRTGERWSATPTPVATCERAAYRWAADVSVYVAANRRGEGLGRSLYEALFERLRRQNFQIACAGITLPNDASVRLHEALGFLRVGVSPRIGWKAGAGTTSAGGSWSWRRPTPGTPLEPLPPQ